MKLTSLFLLPLFLRCSSHLSPLCKLPSPISLSLSPFARFIFVSHYIFFFSFCYPFIIFMFASITVFYLSLVRFFFCYICLRLNRVFLTPAMRNPYNGTLRINQCGYSQRQLFLVVCSCFISSHAANGLWFKFVHEPSRSLLNVDGRRCRTI